MKVISEEINKMLKDRGMILYNFAIQLSLILLLCYNSNIEYCNLL